MDCPPGTTTSCIRNCQWDALGYDFDGLDWIWGGEGGNVIPS